MAVKRSLSHFLARRRIDIAGLCERYSLKTADDVFSFCDDRNLEHPGENDVLAVLGDQAPEPAVSEDQPNVEEAPVAKQEPEPSVEADTKD